MKPSPSNIFITILLVIWIVQAIKYFLSNRNRGLKKITISLFASSCLTFGAISFFGMGLSASGGLNWLPNSFEWPIESVDNAIHTNNGIYVVPLIYPSRIQIYDTNLNFVRGWPIDAYGAEFKLLKADIDTFYIYTLKGKLKHYYNINGQKISTNKYQQSYKDLKTNYIHIQIPIKIYEKPFTHPFIAWIIGMIGVVLIRINNNR